MLLQEMTTRVEPSRGVTSAGRPRDIVTETRRGDRALTSTWARMSRVRTSNADESDFSSSDGSESEEERYSSGVSGSNLNGGHASTNKTTGTKTNGLKLPAFTGKESWKVWINHYTAVAERKDRKTRREDLLRRFLDGLYDEHACFQLEYVNEPADVDETVYQVVNYCKQENLIRVMNSALTESLRKWLEGPHRKKRGQVKTTNLVYLEKNLKGMNMSIEYPPKPAEVKSEKSNEKTLKDKEEYHKLMQKIEELEFDLRQGLQKMDNNKWFTNQGTGTRNEQSYACFTCGEQGHFARDCPLRMIKTIAQANVTERRNGESKYQESKLSVQETMISLF
ncbi:hypothetical protein CHS0354_028992 [Potamilus streckersoni]|uniref:CCHC-type domain-containing protein n=1 Tax=Potamilus streckersoni TaxID=2493646 RepID=A0AAE0T6B6_9BIVA|nr:hypothetical protein CHS0354_028992 [Potamilus streckersoni]